MIAFDKIPYERPDVPAGLAEYDRLTARLTAAQDETEALSCFRAHEALLRHFETMKVYAKIRHGVDLTDRFFEEEADFFCGAAPLWNERVQGFYQALYASPFRPALERELGPVFFKNMALSIRASCPENIPLEQEEARLCARYTKLLASARVPVEGEILNLEQLRSREESLDRAERRRAFLGEAAFFKANEAEFDEIFDRLVKLRTQMAKNLGCENYVELGYRRMTRNCYDAAQVARFREAVVEEALPAVKRIKAAQAARLGLSKLFWYDDGCCFPEGNPRPAAQGEALLAMGRQMYGGLGKEAGEFYEFLLEYGLFDAMARPGKASGGYCEYLPEYGAPFIFANFNGTADDVDTLTHEAGHALAFYLARELPVSECVVPTLDVCEIHSMTMELFAYPYHDLFYGSDAPRSRQMHLENALCFLPYGCMVDEFQHIIYEKTDMTPAGRKAVWKELEGKYRPYLTFEGEFFGEGMWFMRQSHIYKNPFYYIDYCLAQAVALQFWGWAQRDRDAALSAYFDLVKKAGTKTFAELVAEAGLKDPFAPGCLREVVETLE